eukprot:6214303-Pleurochrysis_carterae.AAC.3
MHTAARSSTARCCAAQTVTARGTPTQPRTLRTARTLTRLQPLLLRHAISAAGRAVELVRSSGRRVRAVPQTHFQRIFFFSWCESAHENKTVAAAVARIKFEQAKSYCLARVIVCVLIPYEHSDSYDFYLSDGGRAAGPRPCSHGDGSSSESAWPFCRQAVQEHIPAHGMQGAVISRYFIFEFRPERVRLIQCATVCTWLDQDWSGLPSLCMFM